MHAVLHSDSSRFPQLRPVVQFQVHSLSRLAALENLGFATNTSLLIEGGDINFLQQPITMTADRDTVAGVINTILHGKENYTILQRDALLILRPAAPSRPLNRILKLRMTNFSFTGNSISSLSPLIGFYLRKATGCDPQGYVYVGPPMSLDIPPIPSQIGFVSRHRGASRVSISAHNVDCEARYWRARLHQQSPRSVAGYLVRRSARLP